jgi:hypothetical protein
MFLGVTTRVRLSALAFYKKLLFVFYKRAQTNAPILNAEWFSVGLFLYDF